MKRQFVILVIALCPMAASAQLPAEPDQQQQKRTVADKVKSPKPARDVAAEQRRMTALSLLMSLADEAKSFKDNMLRARVLAQSADTLWDSNRPQALSLFHRAWSEAEQADKVAAENEAVDAKRQQGRTGATVRWRIHDVRAEVLLFATRRDRALGEEFLKLLDESQKQENANTSTNTPALDPSAASASDSKRLRLATHLLQSGDIDRALQIADPALVRVNTDSVFFLSYLREKNAAAADQRFTAMVNMAAQNPATDANTVSGLSSYLFTPFLYMTFSREGGVNSNQSKENQVAPEVAPGLRTSFLQFATQILMRQLPPPDQDTSTSGRVGTALVIKRMMPLFEQYLPDSFAELNSTVAALASDATQREQWDDNSNLKRGLVPDDPNKDTSRVMQDRLDHAKDSTDRDAIYANYAVLNVRKNYMIAKSLADKIEDSELRKQVRNYVDFQAVSALVVSEKNVAEALQIMHEGQLDHYQRMWGLTQASRTLRAADKVRATELLGEALSEARRIGDGESSDGVEANRARAYVAIASRFVELDKTRAWEIMPEVIKASNAASDYTGQDNAIRSVLRTKFMMTMNSNSVEDFDVTGLFKNLADGDLFRAIDAAKGFSAESTRAAATLAIVRSVLEKKA